MSGSTTSTTESRALELLGQNLPAEVVAAALGVEPSRISQLMADSGFAAQVAEKKFLNLAKHNDRDSKYDELEDALQSKLKNALPYMLKPLEIAKVLQTVNSAKRRGSSAPTSVSTQQKVIPLIMSTQLIQLFTQNNSLTVNTNNQVVKAGDLDLVTIQSGSISKLVQEASQNKQLSNSPHIKESTDV